MYRGQMFILKGVIGIIFGIIAVAIPGFALGALFTIFGLFIIAAGIIAFLFAVTSHPKDSSPWFWISLGILALGLLSVIFHEVIPGVIAFSFAILIAGWALVTGIFDLERCITGRRYYYYLFGGMTGTFIVLLLALFYFMPAFPRNSASSGGSINYRIDPMKCPDSEASWRTAKRCPKCGNRMKIVAFLTQYSVVDRIIDHLKLSFTAERPPP